MPGEGIETVRRAHQALNAGEIDALIALCGPDFRLDMSDRVFNPAVYHGHEGIRAFYAEVMDVWESFTWDVREIEAHEGLVVAFLESTGKARGSGLELDRRSAMVWRVDGATARSLTFYRDPAEAVAAARAGKNHRVED
jgi:ketosteroid isomerase-like protein